jgi:hypothetical protein
MSVEEEGARACGDLAAEVGTECARDPGFAALRAIADEQWAALHAASAPGAGALERGQWGGAPSHEGAAGGAAPGGPSAAWRWARDVQEEQRVRTLVVSEGGEALARAEWERRLEWWRACAASGGPAMLREADGPARTARRPRLEEYAARRLPGWDAAAWAPRPVSELRRAVLREMSARSWQLEEDGVRHGIYALAEHDGERATGRDRIYENAMRACVRNEGPLKDLYGALRTTLSRGEYTFEHYWKPIVTRAGFEAGLRRRMESYRVAHNPATAEELRDAAVDREVRGEDARLARGCTTGAGPSFTEGEVLGWLRAAGHAVEVHARVCDGGRFGHMAHLADIRIPVRERGVMVVVEVDERAHGRYDGASELERMGRLLDISAHAPGRMPMHGGGQMRAAFVVRYNPHTPRGSAVVAQEVRRGALLAAVAYLKEEAPLVPTAVYMYYPVVGGRVRAMKGDVVELLPQARVLSVGGAWSDMREVAPGPGPSTDGQAGGGPPPIVYPTVEHPFRCGECAKIFESAIGLRQHERMMHTV